MTRMLVFMLALMFTRVLIFRSRMFLELGQIRLMLFQAAQTKAPDNDDELIDYVNILREGILEGYTGIIQGLKEGDRAEFILPHIDAILGFLELLASERRND